MIHEDDVPDCYKVVRREISRTIGNTIFYTTHYGDGSKFEHNKFCEEILSSTNKDLIDQLLSYLGVTACGSKQQTLVACLFKLDKQLVARLAKTSLFTNDVSTLKECFKYMDIPENLSLKEKISFYQLLESDKA